MHRNAIYLLAVSVVVAFCANPSTSYAQCTPGWIGGDGFAGTNRVVAQLTTWTPPGESNPELVAVGSFSVAGNEFASSVASWNGTRWRAIGALPWSAATAVTVVDGTLYASTGLTVWRLDGSNWQSIGKASGGSVRTLTGWNGLLCVGGEFTSFAGLTSTRVVAWNGSTWTALGAMSGGGVQAMTEYNGELVAGGSLFVTGLGSTSIARWNGTGWSRIGTGVTGTVWSVFVDGGNLYAGGLFAITGLANAKNIAAWNGSDWSALDTGIPQRVSSITLFNGKITAGSTSPSQPIVQWNGSSWTPISTDRFLGGGSINSIQEYAGRLYVGGAFRSVETTRSDYITSWDGDSWKPLGVGGLDVEPDCAEIYRGKLIVGGDMQFIGLTAIGGLAQSDGSSWQPFATSFYSVKALAATDTDLFAAAVASGGALSCFRWDGAAWHAIPGTFFSSSGALAVTAMKVFGGDLIVTGRFASVNGVAVNNIARWDGNQWSALGDGLQQVGTSCSLPPGDALFERNGKLIVGGSFNRAGGQSANSIAEWDGTSWSAIGVGFSSCAVVRCLAEINGELVAGGDLGKSGSTSVFALARWDGSSWLPFSNPKCGVDSILDIAEFGNGVWVGGTYSSPSQLDPISRWDGTTWTSFASDIPNSVSRLLTIGNELIVIGGFESIAGVPAAYVGRFSDDRVPWTALGPTSASVSVDQTSELLATPASNYPGVTYRWQRNTVDVGDGPGGASAGGGNVSGATGSLESPTAGHVVALTISGAQPSDAGEYRLVLENSCGVSWSEPAQLRVGEACPCDLNGDGFVEDSDFSLFVVAYDILDCADPSMPSGCAADFNGDGLVDDADFSVFVPAYNDLLCP